MKDLSGTYVHRGDVERRARRVRGGLLFVGLGITLMAAVQSWAPGEAGAAPVLTPVNRDSAELTGLQRELEAARGELRVATAHLERWNRIFGYAREYRIASDLSASIYDTAVIEGIDPELAFPLVKLESGFDERATSPVGATGLTQLMLATAREYDKSLTKESLYDRETNLRIGFRYLRSLIKWQRGDVQMALLAYNRGPAAVITARELDLDASNGYDRVLLKGYRGRGVLD
ncbi:MAG: transglycosylase SLT domain-containing protein [Gemmatimonadaceae bacterium]|nr:transglycosylase SLT domain-containing protein [Gemmatimonadaceae bacterium]